MDGLSVVANIAGVLTLASAVATFCYINGAALRDYHKDIDALREESTQLSGILMALKNITEDAEEDAEEDATSAPPAPPATPALISPSGVAPVLPAEKKRIIQPEELTSCERTLLELISALNEVKPQTGKVWKNALKRIKWPMKKESLQTLLHRMERHKSGFTVVLSARSMCILLY
jgi:hypothetical protein